MIRELLTAEGTETGDVRDDIDPDELASYCLHALTAAGDLPSKPPLYEGQPPDDRALRHRQSPSASQNSQFRRSESADLRTGAVRFRAAHSGRPVSLLITRHQSRQALRKRAPPDGSA